MNRIALRSNISFLNLNRPTNMNYFCRPNLLGRSICWSLRSADFCRNAIAPGAARFYPVRPGKNLREPGGVGFNGQLSRAAVVDLVYIEISTRSHSWRRPRYSNFSDKFFPSYRASCKSLQSIYSPSHLYSVIHNVTKSTLLVLRSVSLIYLRGYTSR
jgi:hypothetical protein